MAAVHRVSPILARQGAKPTTYGTVPRLGGDRPGVVCHFKSSVGSTAPVKEHRALNDQDSERAQSVGRPKKSLRGRF